LEGLESDWEDFDEKEDLSLEAVTASSDDDDEVDEEDEEEERDLPTVP